MRDLVSVCLVRGLSTGKAACTSRVLLGLWQPKVALIKAVCL